jgi:hypothetical protein
MYRNDEEQRGYDARKSQDSFHSRYDGGYDFEHGWDEREREERRERDRREEQRQEEEARERHEERMAHDRAESRALEDAELEEHYRQSSPEPQRVDNQSAKEKGSAL